MGFLCFILMRCSIFYFIVHRTVACLHAMYVLPAHHKYSNCTDINTEIQVMQIVFLRTCFETDKQFDYAITLSEAAKQALPANDSKT